jgi:hypothetical protein
MKKGFFTFFLLLSRFVYCEGDQEVYEDSKTFYGIVGIVLVLILGGYGIIKCYCKYREYSKTMNALVPYFKTDGK